MQIKDGQGYRKLAVQNEYKSKNVHNLSNQSFCSFWNWYNS